MLLKTYIALSDLALTVKTNKGHRHIKFNPMTGGQSMFQTNDEDVQNALEADSWFGDRFFLKETIDEQKEKERQRKIDAAIKKATKKKEQQMEKLAFASVTDAKKYLVDKFEVSRTMLRSKAEILAFAEEHGISMTIGKAAMAAANEDAGSEDNAEATDNEDAGADEDASEEEEDPEDEEEDEESEEE